MILNELYSLSKKILKEKGIETFDLDSRVLICFVLKFSTADFYLNKNLAVSPGNVKKINRLVFARSKNIPVAYLVGTKEFFGLNFKVDKHVLIPRPESERLVELACIKYKVECRKYNKFMVLDCGTGSGNIIISLAKSLSPKTLDLKPSFFASDISLAALKVAKENAKLHGVEKKIEFVKSDLFSNPKLHRKFNIIIANLPYVPIESYQLSAISYPNNTIECEPKEAIFAADNGTGIIKRFLKAAPQYLNSKGMISIELDPRNAKDLEEYAKIIFPKQKIRLEKDLAGFLRYLIIE